MKDECAFDSSFRLCVLCASVVEAFESDQILLERERYRLHLGVHLQLLKDVLDMAAGCELGDVQALGDLGGAAAGGEHAQHLDFTAGQFARADVDRFAGGHEVRPGSACWFAGRVRLRSIRVRAEQVHEVVVVGCAGTKLEDAHLGDDVLTLLRAQIEREIAYDLTAVGDTHDRTFVGAIAVAEWVAAAEETIAVAADGFVGGKAEHQPSGVVPENDVVGTIRDEDGVRGLLERLKQLRELIITSCQVQRVPSVQGS